MVYRLPVVLSLVLVALVGLSGCRKLQKKARELVEGSSSAKDPVVVNDRPQKPIPKKPKKTKYLTAERVPHADYPTPKLARTDTIFLLEEPERGPHLTRANFPAKPKRKPTAHRHCSLDIDRLICSLSLKTAQPVEAHWQVWRDKQGRALMAHERFGSRVISSVIFAPTEGKGCKQVVRLDGHGTVKWSRHFSADGKQYSERKLNGSNNLKGCGHMKVKRNKAGLTVELRCLQWSGEPMLDLAGVAARTYKRNKAGFIVEQRRLNREGKPVAAHGGVHRTAYTRDKDGRVALTRTYDVEGMPAISPESGCYGLKRTHDPRGLLATRECLGPGSDPARDQNGYCRDRYRRDGRGCRVSKERFVLDKTTGGCTRFRRTVRYTVNDHCLPLTEVCLGEKGNRSSCGLSKPAEYRYTRDSLGRKTAVRHFLANRKPGMDPGCKSHEIRYGHDEKGNVVSENHFGKAGQPVECSGTGYHGIRTIYDAAGRTSYKTFTDKSGKQATNLGCAKRLYQYDNYDHMVGTENHDATGKPISVLGEVYKTFIYDEGHRLFGILLLDAQRKPARYTGCYTNRTCPSSSTPWHAVRIVRDDRGSVSHNLYFGPDKQLLKSYNCKKARCWK